MSIVIDGITLPDFPSEVANYPYYLVKEMGVYQDDGTKELFYSVLASQQPFEYGQYDFGGPLLTFLTVRTNDAMGWATYLDSSNWAVVTIDEFSIAAMFFGVVINGETAQSYLSVPPEMGMSQCDGRILLANHDITVAANFNDEATGWESTDEVYFFKNDTPAEPEYGKIKKQTLKGIANAIRRKTGKKDKIPTPQLASEIDSIVTADNALVLKDNERIYQVGNAENSLYILQHEATAFGSLSS